MSLVLSPLQNEMMAPASSKDSVLSRLTLAAYEDSGYNKHFNSINIREKCSVMTETGIFELMLCLKSGI